MTADHTHALGIAQNQRGEVVMTDYMHQLTTGGGKPGDGYPAVLAFSAGNSASARSIAVTHDATPPLRASESGTNQGPTIAFHPTQDPISGPVSPALGTTSGGMDNAHAAAVRRLTPLECERLMGWPDDHTRWRSDGTEQSDTARYKQCGNGVVSSVAEWIGRHILAAMSVSSDGSCQPPSDTRD